MVETARARASLSAKALVIPIAGPLVFECSAFAVDGQPDLDRVSYDPATPEDAAQMRALVAAQP
ncbi:MAG: hypothetical protein JO255_22630 [Alphaproteobacteria bacterium]|nr:hypothetical protein [Alphaproteobacteria bacterium]